jgi:hypothetical protein
MIDLKHMEQFRQPNRRLKRFKTRINEQAERAIAAAKALIKLDDQLRAVRVEWLRSKADELGKRVQDIHRQRKEGR